ncbi:MAG: asparagine synthase-related protein [Acidimicrobiales bacterium]
MSRFAAAARGADQRTYSDLKTRLLQDLTLYSLTPTLRNEDRNAMAHSIESRPPFLDQELVELVLSLSAHAIIRDGWNRWVQREAMCGTLPAIVRTRRKKIGFTTPEMSWLRAERTLVQGIFRSPAFCASPYWDGGSISKAFTSCCDGTLEESSFFWRILNAEVWLRVFHSTEPLSKRGARPEGSIQQAGDACVPALIDHEGAETAKQMLVLASPGSGCYLFACGPDGRSVWGRVRLGTPGTGSDEGLEEAFGGALAEGTDSKLGLQPGDVVAISAVADRPGGAPRAPVPASSHLARFAGTLWSRRSQRPPRRGPATPRSSAADAQSARLCSELSELAGGTVDVVAAEVTDGTARVLGASMRDTQGSMEGASLETAAWLLGDDPFGARHRPGFQSCS